VEKEPKTQRVPLMMSPSEVARIDAWRREQPDLPSRSEAIRRLANLVLVGKERPGPKHE
jgi:hypothetical protein